MPALSSPAELRVDDAGSRREREARQAGQSAAGPGSATAASISAPGVANDFADVRIHTDVAAARSARALGARAYTVGRDVVFGEGQYAPTTAPGQSLIAHELAHVAQNAREGGTSPGLLSRDPDPNAKTPASAPAPAPAAAPTTTSQPERPPDKLSWKWKDLAIYPLLVDVWKDLALKQLTDTERKQLALNGTEAASFFAWASAIGLPYVGAGGAQFEGDLSKDLSTWSDYTDALQPLTPSKSVIMDGISRIVGLRIDDYLASDLFKLRLKSHVASVTALALLAQGAYSTYQALKTPSEGKGEFTKEDWTKQTGLAVGLVGKIFSEQLKAPDFFDVGPLQMITHPAFALTPFAGGAPPSGLIAEQYKGVGEGEGGSDLKLGATVNLPKLVATSDKLSAADIGDPKKYRGWQTSAWFTYEKFDPTATMLAAGKLPEEKLKGGAIFGGGGHFGLLEAGARYSGDHARALTSWFVNGGYGYSFPKDSVVQRLGFTATYVDWTDKDILAPGRDTGSPTAGSAARITPFAKLEFGDRNKFGIGAALSFVTGSGESFNVSDVRGDLSYTYVGDTSNDKLPVFKLDLSGSLSRLDWWNPNSPLMWGVQAKTSVNRAFGGVQVQGGAGGIPESRAAIIDKPEKVRVPTGVLFVGGYNF